MVDNLPSWIVDHPCFPSSQPGIYLDSAGDEITTSALHAIQRVHPHNRLCPDRIPVIRQALVAYARSRFDPAFTDFTPWLPTGERYTPFRDVIDPLIAHPFWANLQVLAAPLHVCDLPNPALPQRLRIATTADLLVRFRNGDDLGLAILQTSAPETMNRQGLLAELGAAATLWLDQHGHRAPLSRCFLIFSRPGRTTIEMHGLQEAMLAWVECRDSYRWLQHRLGGLLSRNQAKPAA